MIPLRDSHPANIFPLWILAIIVANIYVFYLQLITPDLDTFILQYALIPRLIDPFFPETLMPFITSQFLHGGFIHIISNMLFLWVFGDNIEERFGFLIFPIFYLASGIVAALSQYVFIPSSPVPMLGASGAVAGVLGAYFALYPTHKIKTLIPVFGFPAIIDIPAQIMLFYWFITQLFAGVASIGISTADIGGIAFFAHVGGFAFGWIFAQLFKSRS